MGWIWYGWDDMYAMEYVCYGHCMGMNMDTVWYGYGMGWVWYGDLVIAARFTLAGGMGVGPAPALAIIAPADHDIYDKGQSSRQQTMISLTKGAQDQRQTIFNSIYHDKRQRARDP